MEKDHKKVRPITPTPPGLLTQFVDYLAANSPEFHGTTVSSLEELCDVIDAAAETMTPVTAQEIEDLLNEALPGNANPALILRVIACLLELNLIVEGVA